MILIANKGLMNGPDTTLENKPEQISEALSLGFHAKIDLWFVDNKLYLGQDNPQYEITLDFLQNKPIWVQAKNTETLYFLSQSIAINYFWHQTDDHVVTRNAYLWTSPGKTLTPRSIQVLPEINDPQFENLNLNCFGICSDYVNQLKEIIDQTS